MTRRKKALVMIAAVMAVIFVTAGFWTIYFIRQDSGGTVLWNKDAAYLFIGDSKRGFHMRALEYPWEILKESLRAVRSPVDERGLLLVIEITPTTVERHEFYPKHNTAGDYPSLYTEVEEQIYADCPYLGGLCRWAGDHFEKVADNEEKRLGGLDRLSPDTAFHSNSWSKDGIAGGPINTKPSSWFRADVGGKFAIWEKREPRGGGYYATVSICLQRPGRAAEEVWHIDGSPRRISKTEYQHAFGLR